MPNAKTTLPEQLDFNLDLFIDKELQAILSPNHTVLCNGCYCEVCPKCQLSMDAPLNSGCLHCEAQPNSLVHRCSDNACDECDRCNLCSGN